MTILKEFKGQNGKIIVYDDYIELSKKTISGFMSQGGSSGNRRYYYNDIDSIEYKSPSLIANGYLKVLSAGSNESNAKVGILASSMESMQDQNTIVIRAFTKATKKEADQLYELVMENISKSKKEVSNANQVTITNTSSKMDELKKLSELKESGILNDEEFENEKQKLLNL